MAQVQIEYDRDEVRDLIAEDIKRKFGIKVSSDQVNEGPLDGQWIATIEKGVVDAEKRLD